MYYHTKMPKTKVALTLDAELLEQVDELVAKRRFRNRSQAVEAALADKLRRLARTRLARESARLNSAEERRFADEGLIDAGLKLRTMRLPDRFQVLRATSAFFGGHTEFTYLMAPLGNRERRL